MLDNGQYRRSWVSRGVIYPVLFGGLPLVVGLSLLIAGDPAIPGGAWQEGDMARIRIGAMLVAIGAAAVGSGIITLFLLRRPYLIVNPNGIQFPGQSFPWCEIRRLHCETTIDERNGQEHSRLQIAVVRNGQELAYDFMLDGLADPPTIGHALRQRWAHEIGLSALALPAYEAKIQLLLKRILWEVLFVYPRTNNAQLVPAFSVWQQGAIAMFFFDSRNIRARSGQAFTEAWCPVALNSLADLSRCWDRRSLEIAALAAIGCSLIAGEQYSGTADLWLAGHFQRLASSICGLTPDVRTEFHRRGIELPIMIRSSLAEMSCDPELLPADRTRLLTIGAAATVASLLVSGDPRLLSPATLRDVSGEFPAVDAPPSIRDKIARLLSQLRAAGLVNRQQYACLSGHKEQELSTSAHPDGSSLANMIQAALRSEPPHQLAAVDTLLSQDDLLGTCVLSYVAATAVDMETRKAALGKLTRISPILAAQVAALEWWRDARGTLSPREAIDSRGWIGALHYAIWLPASWQWWDSDDNMFLFGFAPVCMWEKGLLPGEIPSAPLCIGFRQVKHVVFLQFHVDDEEPLTDNWPEDLRRSAEPSFRINEILFCDARSIAETLRQATWTQHVWGEEASLAADMETARYSMAVQAERAGVVVMADDMGFMKGSSREVMTVDDAYTMVLAWQAYHGEYHKRRGTPFPLPRDILCEIVHPARL